MIIRFTGKQLEILEAIKAGNEDGTFCSIYDILDKLSYKARRDAVRHSIKILIDAELVETMRGPVRKIGRPNTLFKITSKGLELI